MPLVFKGWRASCLYLSLSFAKPFPLYSLLKDHTFPEAKRCSASILPHGGKLVLLPPAQNGHPSQHAPAWTAHTKSLLYGVMAHVPLSCPGKRLSVRGSSCCKLGGLHSILHSGGLPVTNRCPQPFSYNWTRRSCVTRAFYKHKRRHRRLKIKERKLPAFTQHSLPLSTTTSSK